MRRAADAGLSRRLPRLLAILALYALLLLAGRWLGDRLTLLLDLDLRAHPGLALHWAVLLCALAYAVLLAIPFVPGVEVGLGMMLILGPATYALVYLGTVLGLTLGFAAGRLVPARACARALGALGLERAQDLVLRLAPLDADARQALLLARAPARLLPLLLRHRYLALALALNLPGNALLGGGGGIALIAGMSGLYPWPRYLATVALAVAPVPLLLWLHPMP